ncbi:MAG: hypothetical protein HN816_05935 [Gammaproteobacteria bacterium]|nr:hypothetical protein [Gammaproteobacteria bacterium]
MELILILGLLVIFLVPMLSDLNVGVVAIVVAICTGTFLLDYSGVEVMAGFPAQMFVLLAGITLLLAVANQNGTVDWAVEQLMRLARGRLILLPWVLFATAFVTASLGPGAAPVLFVIGIGFVSRFKLNPLLVAAMIIHGTQSGAYSPIAPYGVVIQQLASESGMIYSPTAMFVGVVTFHLVLVVAVFLLLGGLNLKGKQYSIGSSHSDLETLTPIKSLTLAGFLALLVAVLGFKANLGFVAMTIAFILLLFSDRESRIQSVNEIAWPIILVICGVLTYVNMIQSAGAIDWLANQLGNLGSPNIIGLLLCFTVAIVTGVASTMGTIGMLVPLSAPFVVSGDLSGTGLLTAMAISAAVTDISPFSTWGALFLATAASVVNKEEMLRKQIVYTLIILCVVPITAWLVFIIF